MEKKKKKAKAQSNFDPQEFMIFHAEKFVFGIIALLALGLIYIGFSAKQFPESKTPDKLKKLADDTLRQVNTEDHWSAMSAEPDRKVPNDFAVRAAESRRSVDANEYKFHIKELDTNSMSRRSDPLVSAPIKLETSYYSGAILVPKSGSVDFLNKLADAKEKEEKAPKPAANSRPGSLGSSGPPPGYGMTGGSSGPPPGYPGSGSQASFGDGDQEGGQPIAKRRLSPGYDRGFRFGMRTFPLEMPLSGQALPPTAADAAKKKLEGPASTQFIAVTALAPHEEMEEEYKKRLKEADGYMVGRDTPNYMGFEVQRVDVTDNPAKEVREEDWQPLPESSSDRFRESSKNWLGSCNEVHLNTWTTATISMPIPPVLVKDYRAIAKHSEIPMSGQSAIGAPGGGMMGGKFGNRSDDDESGDVPSMMSGSGMGKMSGMGSLAGAGGPPAGYSGSSGPPAGYSGSSGPPAGYPGSSGGPPPGYGAMGGPPPGYPGGSGSQTGSGTGPVAPTVETPKQLPSTKYKLVRFYDFKIASGHVYRYRVRLKMYDPNYPEAASIQPRSETMDVVTLKRVQDLMEKDQKASDGKPVYKRKSSLMTKWSDPSSAIAALRVAEGYVSEANIANTIITNSGKELWLDPTRYESSPPSAAFVFAEWDNARSIFIPRKESVERGFVFGAPMKEKGREVPFEIIHPITKAVKNLPKADVKTDAQNMFTVIDIRGLLPLEMKTAKEPFRDLKTGAECVAYDPGSNQLVVTREFEDFSGYGFHTQPDKEPIGPLGGGLRLSADVAGAAGGEMGGMSGPGMGMGMGGAMGNPGGMMGGKFGGMGALGGVGSDK